MLRVTRRRTPDPSFRESRGGRTGEPRQRQGGEGGRVESGGREDLGTGVRDRDRNRDRGRGRETGVGEETKKEPREEG